MYLAARRNEFDLKSVSMKPLKKYTASTTVCCLVLMLNACSGGSGEGLDKSGQTTSKGDQGADTEANSDTGGDLFTRI